MHHFSTDDSRDPALDFPESVADLYPEEFRYPIGYLPGSSRVTDRAVLLRFHEFERPYLDCAPGNEVRIDGRLRPSLLNILEPHRNRDLLGMTREIRWDGLPDASLQATFDCEDQITLAKSLAAAGLYRRALDTIRQLSAPFQQNAEAVRVVVTSLAQLGFHREALREIQDTAAAFGDAHEGLQDWRVFAELEVLLLCGHTEEVRTRLNDIRRQPHYPFQYYGLRAALALHDGDPILAEFLIVRAGRIAPWQAYHLLWNPVLAPLRGFIRKTLLTSEGKSLPAELDGQSRRRVHHTQGALLSGRSELALDLIEGVILHHITDAQTGEEYTLALAGLGMFQVLAPICHVLRGSRVSLQAVGAVARYALGDEHTSADAVTKAIFSAGCSAVAREHLIHLLPVLRGAPADSLPPIAQTLVAIVRGPWSARGRECSLVLQENGNFVARCVFEPNSRDPLRPVDGLDLLAAGKLTGSIQFPDRTELENWLETKLRECVPPPGFGSRGRSVDFSSIPALQLLRPEPKRTPILSEVWTMLIQDPLLYFQNGPTGSLPYQPPFGERLVRLLDHYCRCR